MTRSEALAAARAAPSERAGVSTTTKSTPLARAVSKVMGSRLALRIDHHGRVCFAAVVPVARRGLRIEIDHRRRVRARRCQRPGRDEHDGTAWCLDPPVHRGDQARAHPLRLLARVSEWMAYACGADPTYTAVLTHNPYKPAQDSSLNTKWGRRDPYTLHELAEPIPRYWHKPDAGSPSNLGAPVLDVARGLNAEFVLPLRDAEESLKVGRARS